MMGNEVRFSSKGGVFLSDSVICDGFVYNVPLRVQTHIHDDHMKDFNTSKGSQTILMSEPTRHLLIAEFGGDLAFRPKIVGLPYGTIYTHGDNNIQLLPNGHMLGSVQVVLENKDGARTGYSGDFNWPMENVMQTDVLVVDSTYGSPEKKKNYSQEDVNHRFVEMVVANQYKGPVHIKGYRGLIQRALSLIHGNGINVPVLVSRRMKSQIEVYQNFGYTIDNVIELGSEDGKEVMKSNRYVRLYGTGDGDLDGVASGKGSSIYLTAYWAQANEPVLELAGDRVTRIAMTDHADFDGTIEYILATKAKHVITDPTRGGSAFELSSYIKDHLGITSEMGHCTNNLSWGT